MYISGKCVKMSLTVPQISGDFIQLFSFIILIFRICKYKSSAGISARTQLLFLLIFCTRYYTLPFLNYYIIFRCLFICLTCVTMILIYFVYNETYEKKLDTFRIEFLILWALVLAYFFNYEFTTFELLWAFSEYLEAVAAWPQFFMINKTRQVSKLIFFYLSALGLYRILYIANWVEQFYESNYFDYISCGCGSIQLVPYLIFWILCLTKVVVIIKDGTLWYQCNLEESCNQKEIFVIQVPNEKEKADKLPLLTNLEQVASVN